MRRLPLIFVHFVLFAFVTASCRMQPSPDLGDTIPESVFWLDTAKPKQVKKTAAVVRDSLDIFYVGTGSTPSLLQLVSYPSHRDTLMAGKRKPLRVVGNADYGHVVRITWHHRSATDSVVSSVEEIVPVTVKASIHPL